MSQRKSFDIVDRLIKNHASFRRANSEERKKDILCVAITYSEISDFDLLNYGIDNLDHCKRMCIGINNYLILYNRKVVSSDKYEPISESTSCVRLFDKSRKESKSSKVEPQGKSVLNIFSIGLTGNIECDFYDCIRFMHKQQSKLDDIRYDCDPGVESRTRLHDSIVETFEWGISRAFNGGNYEGVRYNLEKAAKLPLNQYLSPDHIKKIFELVGKYIELLHSKGTQIKQKK